MSVDHLSPLRAFGKLQEQLKQAISNEKKVMKEYRELKQVVAALKKWEHAAKTEKNEALRLTQQLEIKESQIARRENENGLLRQRVNELEGYLEELKNKMDSAIMSLSKKVIEMTDKYEIERSINEHRQREFQTFHVGKREMKKVILEKQQLVHQLSHSKGEQIKLKEELERRISMEIFSHNGTKTELKRQMELGSELQRRLLDQQKATIQFKALYLQNEKLKDALMEYQEQAQALMEANEALMEDRDKMEESIIKWELEQEALSEKLELKIKTLEIQNSSESDNNCLLKDEEIASLRARVKEMETKNTVLQHEMTSMGSRGKEMEEELRNALTTIDDLTAKNNNLMSDHMALDTTLDKVTASYRSTKKKLRDTSNLLQQAGEEKQNLLETVENIKAKATQQEEELTTELRQCKQQVADHKEALDHQRSLTVTLESTMEEKDKQMASLTGLLSETEEQLRWLTKKNSRAMIPGCVRELLTKGKKHTLHKRFMQKCFGMAKMMEEFRSQSSLISQLQQKLAQHPEDIVMELQSCKWIIRALKKRLQGKEALNEVFFLKINKMHDSNESLTNEVRKLRLEVGPPRSTPSNQTRSSLLNRPKWQPNRVLSSTTEENKDIIILPMLKQ